MHCTVLVCYCSCHSSAASQVAVGSALSRCWRAFVRMHKEYRTQPEVFHSEFAASLHTTCCFRMIIDDNFKANCFLTLKWEIEININ